MENERAPISEGSQRCFPPPIDAGHRCEERTRRSPRRKRPGCPRAAGLADLRERIAIEDDHVGAFTSVDPRDERGEGGACSLNAGASTKMLPLRWQSKLADARDWQRDVRLRLKQKAPVFTVHDGNRVGR